MQILTYMQVQTRNRIMVSGKLMVYTITAFPYNCRSRVDADKYDYRGNAFV